MDSPLPGRRAALGALGAVALLGLTASACGGAQGGGAPSTTQVQPKPSRTYAGPKGLRSGGQPQTNGFMWLLARTPDTTTLQQLNLTTGKISQVIPESLQSVSMAQSSSGVIGVGLGTESTGAFELRNGSSGYLVATVAIGAPVKDVFAGADGSTFYVLNGNAATTSVTLVNSQTHQPSVSVPVPLDTVSIAVDPSGQDLFALEARGVVDEISVGSGKISGTIKGGAEPEALAVSVDGSTLYVLKSEGTISDVSVIHIATESQTAALPAASDSVGIQVAPDGQSLYDLVGTGRFGNIQVFPISS